MAVDYYETLGQQDLNVGTGTFSSRNPGGGTLTSTQIGLHSFARNQLKTTATWDPGSVANGSNTSTTVAVAGAALGDFVLASFSLDLQGLQMTAYVSSSGTVTVLLQNLTGAAVDLSSGTLAILAFTTA